MPDENYFTEEQSLWTLLNQWYALTQSRLECSHAQKPFCEILEPETAEEILLQAYEAGFENVRNFLSGLNKALLSEERYTSHPEKIRWKKIRDYVETHYTQDVKIARLGNHLGMSEAGFSRFFKQLSGEHFIDYLNAVRLRHAAIALIRTKERVTGIAYGCGFNTVFYFIRLFKKKRGITAAEYRQQVQALAGRKGI